MKALSRQQIIKSWLFMLILLFGVNSHATDSFSLHNPDNMAKIELKLDTSTSIEQQAAIVEQFKQDVSNQW